MSLERSVDENEVEDRKMRILLDLLSHDINNHIYGSMGYLELVQSMLQNDPALMRYLSNSMSELKSISHLVDNVRLLVNITMEPFEGEPVDVTETLRKAKETAEYQIDRKKLNLTHSFKEGECVVKADRFLQDLLTQLLMNSMKYSRADEANVSLAMSLDNDMVTIVYEDDGMGISNNIKDMVFTRFDRSVQEGDVHGKGMGLSVVSNVIKRYGGDISLEDIRKEDKVAGTRFLLKIPNWG